MNYALGINGRRRRTCVDVCEAVIWRIWQEASERGQNGSEERGLANCSRVSWNHRAAGKWINKYPLQPCCPFPCFFGRAGKARSPVAAFTLVRQTAADLEKTCRPASQSNLTSSIANTVNYSDSALMKARDFHLHIIMTYLKHFCCHRINKQPMRH